MKYISRNGQIKIFGDETIASSTLSSGTYRIHQDPISGEFSLMTIDNFSVPDIIYGDEQLRCERVIQTYFDRKDKSTGVLLSGEKGSGKTLCCKIVSKILREKHNIPTIVINDAFCGEEFNSFIDSISCDAMVLFDEFEKTYFDTNKQSSLLTLFDGVYMNRKMFMVTCNNSYSLNKAMINRPSRFYYNFRYKGLKRDFIIDYAETNLINQDHKDGLIKFYDIFEEFNFDMLSSIIEEMNRYNESAGEVAQNLNVAPAEIYSEYEIKDFKYKFSDLDSYSKMKNVELKTATVSIESPDLTEFWLTIKSEVEKSSARNSRSISIEDQREPELENENWKINFEDISILPEQLIHVTPEGHLMYSHPKISFTLIKRNNGDRPDFLELIKIF